MIRRFLPLFCLMVYIAFGLVWRAWWQARWYGSAGIMLFRSGRRDQNIRDALLVLKFLLIGGQAMAAAIAPQWLSAIGLPFIWDREELRWVGAAIVLVGTALVVASQVTLGASWRVGIEEGARPGLVTHGVYRYVRNPIFLCLMIVVAGFVLLMPTWLSLAVLAGSYFGIREQARAEEAYLMRAYGDKYRTYARRVGRFVPFIGRLAK